MLSYMLPVEEKPAGGGAGRGALQLPLGRRGGGGGGGGGRPPVAPPPPPPVSAISKESSSSSFASSELAAASSTTPTGAAAAAVAAHDRPRHKLLANGTKHTTLKRVSFGSSKGSMVETLIYESPLAEEPESSTCSAAASAAAAPAAVATAAAAATDPESERSKVRVSFYQGARAQCVSPPPSDSPHALAALLATSAASGDDMAATAAVVFDSPQPHYNRQMSTESGWDNPFRPDGDLSREADEIVSLIKGGKPITPTPTPAPPLLPSVDEIDKHQAAELGGSSTVLKMLASCRAQLSTRANDIAHYKTVTPPGGKQPSPKPSPAGKVAPNGTKNGGGGAGAVDVQRTAPPEPQQAERIVLKKKPKCKCCVVQ